MSLNTALVLRYSASSLKPQYEFLGVDFVRLIVVASAGLRTNWCAQQWQKNSLVDS
jgi:hypothetical protein